MANVGASSSSSGSSGGVRVGKYELLRNLGTGNTAVVKLAFHVETRQRVAIKIIDKINFLGKKKSQSNNSLRNTKIEAIKLEITIMKMIKHPNVVGVIEVMATETKIYIVMELVDGRELFYKINRITMRGMTEDEARNYFQQLMCAVDYCHSKGVFHRDLKPENLLVDINGVLKVSDFGLSAMPQQFGSDGLLHTACGTLQYTAPEVIGLKGYDGAKADIWSCGVILFFMNAGDLPFTSDDNDRRVVYRKIINAEYTFPPFFSTSLKGLIQRILVPNPNSRITMNEIFEDEWFKQGYQPPKFSLDDDSEDLLDDRGKAVCSRPVGMNAFEILSTFVGYDLIGNLFNRVREKSEARFISQCTTDEVIAGIEHVSKNLGFTVKRRRNFKVSIKSSQGGRQGHLTIVTEISEMAPSIYMVEVRKVGGDTREFHRFYKDLCAGIQDIILIAERVDAGTDGASTSTTA